MQYLACQTSQRMYEVTLIVNKGHMVYKAEKYCVNSYSLSGVRTFKVLTGFRLFKLFFPIYMIYFSSTEDKVLKDSGHYW